MILPNHGLLVMVAMVDVAFTLMYILERTCRAPFADPVLVPRSEHHGCDRGEGERVTPGHFGGKISEAMGDLGCCRKLRLFPPGMGCSRSALHQPCEQI